MQRTFSYGPSGVVTIHRQRNADLLDAEMVIAILMDGVDPANRSAWKRRWLRAAKYADTLASIDTVDGDPGFPIPSLDAPESELRTGFDAWLNENGFYLTWTAAHMAVNAPIGDADTAPGVDADPNA